MKPGPAGFPRRPGRLRKGQVVGQAQRDKVALLLGESASRHHSLHSHILRKDHAAVAAAVREAAGV